MTTEGPTLDLLPPEPSSMPRRRALVLAGGMLVAGAALGAPVGYRLARTSAKRAPAEAPSVAGTSAPAGGTEDPELAALRRLAVHAPIDELFALRLQFVESLARHHRRDEVLWRGIDRLADAVRRDRAMRDRRIVALMLAQVMERADAPFRERYAAAAVELRRIR
jgi:hypothetical protein